MITKRSALLSALGLAGTLLTAGHAHGLDTLFRDTFDRTLGTDLNTSNGGKSGTYSTAPWIEGGVNGEALIDENTGGTVRRLVLKSTTSAGTDGIVAYPDVNFTGLSAFQVEFRILTGASAGNGRQMGFSVGQSKTELETIAGANNGTSVGDFYVGVDYIGNNPTNDWNINIRQNGGNVKTLSYSALSAIDPDFGMPDTITAYFTFPDMNSGSDLNYDLQLNGMSIDTGTVAWSGTDENYIAFQSNYTTGAFLSYVDIKGEPATTPAIPGDTDGDGDVDDSDLGTSFSNYTGPITGGTKTAAEGDTDGDGDVDNSDLGTSFSNYTGPLSPTSVPEPTSLALIGLGGLAMIRRRRA